VTAWPGVSAIFMCAGFFLHDTNLSIVAGAPRPAEVTVKSHGIKSTALNYSFIPRKSARNAFERNPVYRVARLRRL
jgi:hypothetical protein